MLKVFEKNTFSRDTAKRARGDNFIFSRLFRIRAEIHLYLLKLMLIVKVRQDFKFLDQEVSMAHWWKAALALSGLAVVFLGVPTGVGGAEGAKGNKSDKAGVSCVESAKGPLGGAPTPAGGSTPVTVANEIRARVGKPAPDFEASAFVNGGFKNIKLSDYKGKWVVLCFYPGDFTFV